MTKKLTIAEYVEYTADCSFVVGCLTRYFDKHIKPSTKLNPLPDDVEFADYITSIAETHGIESTSDVVDDSSASYMLYFFANTFTAQLLYPETDATIEPVPAE